MVEEYLHNPEIWNIVLPTTKTPINYTEEQKLRYLQKYLKKIDIVNITIHITEEED